jgi:nucleotide-binding universal stress UspA family protein
LAGTIVCGVTDSPGGRAALGMAAELCARLKLRLVLVHVAGGPGSGEDGSPSNAAGRQGAARLLTRLAAEYRLTDHERRAGVGDTAEVLARIAAEEAADAIVIGATPFGRIRRGLRSRIAGELEGETPVPVVIASPHGVRSENLDAGRYSSSLRDSAVPAVGRLR